MLQYQQYPCAQRTDNSQKSAKYKAKANRNSSETAQITPNQQPKLTAFSTTKVFKAEIRLEKPLFILAEAACRLAGISVKSPNSSRFCSKRADSSLTVLDLSSQIGINVCEDKPLDSKEL